VGRAAAKGLSTAALAVTYLGFVSLGLPDALLGVAWPSVRGTFGLSPDALGVLLAGAGAGYLAASSQAGRLLRHMGVGPLLAGSSALVAAGLTLSAASPTWWLFLLGMTLVGLGSGAIDAGLNAHAAVHLSAGQMSWLHAAYGAGATGGPLVMTAVLTAGAPWRAGYGTVAAVLAAMALLFTGARRLLDAPPAAASHAPPSHDVHPGLLAALQVGLFFLLTGLESTTSQWAYSVLTEARGVAPTAAGLCVALFWASFTGGRILAGFGAERVGTQRLMRAGGLLALAGSVAFLSGRADVLLAPVALVLLGLGLAPLYPGMMSLTPRRVGEAASPRVVGWQVAGAFLGAVALPALGGVLARAAGLEAVGVLMLVLGAVFLAGHEWLVRLAPAPEPLRVRG
jgi:fucose permease